MCGIIGIVVNPLYSYSQLCLCDWIKTGLLKIQHRGYDGAGIACGGFAPVIGVHKGYGLIRNVLTGINGYSLNDPLNDPLNGLMGLGHTRYKTKGECSANACQPLLSESGRVCLVHNGQIEVADHYLPDSSWLLEHFEEEWQTSKRIYHSDRSDEDHIWSALRSIADQMTDGSYSCLLMIQGYGLVAFRDYQGIRPLVYGQTNPGGHWVLASEDVALKGLPFDYVSGISGEANGRADGIRDLPPGSAVIFRLDGQVFHKQLTTETRLRPCLFEYIYLANQTSTMNGISVANAREELGHLLAQKIRKQDWWREMISDTWCDTGGSLSRASDSNVIIAPIPETSCLAAQVVADDLGVPYRHLIRLNPKRKHPRSFILPTQKQRENAVSDKFILDMVQLEELGYLKDFVLLLVDDSIVRGTTLTYLVRQFRQICPNVRAICLASLAPAIRDRNTYGIDVPIPDRLVAFRYPEEHGIARVLGADQVVYQDLDQIVTSWRNLSSSRSSSSSSSSIIDGFETSMFAPVELYLDRVSDLMFELILDIERQIASESIMMSSSAIINSAIGLVHLSQVSPRLNRRITPEIILKRDLSGDRDFQRTIRRGWPHYNNNINYDYLPGTYMTRKRICSQCKGNFIGSGRRGKCFKCPAKKLPCYICGVLRPAGMMKLHLDICSQIWRSCPGCGYRSASFRVWRDHPAVCPGGWKPALRNSRALTNLQTKKRQRKRQRPRKVI